LHFPKEIFLEFINAFLEHGKQLEEKVNWKNIRYKN
jgi:hypothetical protein